MTDKELVPVTRQTLTTTWEEDIRAAKFAIESSAYQAIEAGRLLSAAKEKFGVINGVGGSGWEQAVEERGISRRTADEFIQVYRRLGNSLEFAAFVNKVVVSEDLGAGSPSISTKSLRRLAAPSTPEKAIEMVSERLEADGRITTAATEEIIAQAKAEARAEQLAADREELRKAVKLSEDRVTNMEAVVNQATTARREAEKHVVDLEARMATGPSARLKQELEDAQDKLYSMQQEVDSLSTDLISERNKVRQLQLSRQTSDDARNTRRLFVDAATRATAALVEVAGYDLDPEYFIDATWAALDTLRAQMKRTDLVLNRLKQDEFVESD